MTEGEPGDVSITYNNPYYPTRRHQTPDDLIAGLGGAGPLPHKVVAA